ncbi:hypothetical protein O7627_09990 [Solwaraspora sp. WMMD1047]|uniref:hypothetical protein n=1 Tax=Solwaraspora sp. WMMD1047 TaxID=3016102 RepID=UPI002415FA56|nr:hypothetical protein [Solwaraspora sp. WMMD1047]MDG4829632.1 hypothetical protein [Solwaraspora sp. WMMD1047]
MTGSLTLDQVVEELSRPAVPDLASLVRLLLPENPARSADPARLTAADLAAWRSLLRDIPFDRRSFDDRFRPGSWQATVNGLTGACGRYVGPASDDAPSLSRQVVGLLALLLITMTGLSESSDRRTGVAPTGAGHREGPGRSGGHDCPGICGHLVRQEPVREVIRELYQPETGATPEAADGEALAVAEWTGGIDFATLEFHEHGTTSMILRGSGHQRGGQRRPFALKLILYPYLRIPRIAGTTRAYAWLYDLVGSRAEHLVRIWASAESWILMDFVDGRPLDEVWRERVDRWRDSRPGGSAVNRNVLLDDLRAYGTAVLLALAELDRLLNHADIPDAFRRGHGDLTPSNIIVTYRNGSPVFRLIDIGANYLYTYTFGALEGPDGRFVAPEVKADGAVGEKSDLYSLGKLLIMFGGGEPGDIVPDAFYAHAPLLARFIEDLIDERSDRRLLVFSSSWSVNPESGSHYDQLRTAFLAELDAEAARIPPTDNHIVRGTWNLFQTRLTFGLFRPLAGVPGQLRRIYRIRREEPGVAGQASTFAAARLLAWSWLSSVAWAVTFTITAIWIIRQLDWSWGNRMVEAVQWSLGGSDDNFPFLDSLRAPGYEMPNLTENAPALLVGLTYAMVSAKYYQNIFAGMNPLVAGWRAGGLTTRAVAAQWFMRVQTVTGAALVLPIVLYDPRFWPINSAIGQTFSLLTNGSGLLFARRALADARRRGLSTVPPTDANVTGLASFAEWTPSSLFYAGVVWVIGIPLYQGALRDVYVYALSVASINLFLFYMIKCGRGAAEIRVVLTRATCAAERLRHLPANR